MEVELPLAETSICHAACLSGVEWSPPGVVLAAAGRQAVIVHISKYLFVRFDGVQIAFVDRVSFLLLLGYQIQKHLHCHLWIIWHLATDGQYPSVRFLGNIRFNGF